MIYKGGANTINKHQELHPVMEKKSVWRLHTVFFSYLRAPGVFFSRLSLEIFWRVGTGKNNILHKLTKTTSLFHAMWREIGVLFPFISISAQGRFHMIFRLPRKTYLSVYSEVCAQDNALVDKSCRQASQDDESAKTSNYIAYFCQDVIHLHEVEGDGCRQRNGRYDENGEPRSKSKNIIWVPHSF